MLLLLLLLFLLLLLLLLFQALKFYMSTQNFRHFLHCRSGTSSGSWVDLAYWLPCRIMGLLLNVFSGEKGVNKKPAVSFTSNTLYRDQNNIISSGDSQNVFFYICLLSENQILVAEIVLLWIEKNSQFIFWLRLFQVTSQCPALKSL